MIPPGPEPKRDNSALRRGKPEGPLLSAALVAGLLAAAATAVAEPATIRGVAEVLDGRRMIVAGHEIVLADIEVPAPGTPCRIRGNPLDCGRLARAGLMDIVAGSEVACSPVRPGQHRCLASGYDVAFGLVHAGWAIPVEGAPTHYGRKMTEAKKRGRGLWSAQP